MVLWCPLLFTELLLHLALVFITSNSRSLYRTLTISWCRLRSLRSSLVPIALSLSFPIIPLLCEFVGSLKFGGAFAEVVLPPYECRLPGVGGTPDRPLYRTLSKISGCSLIYCSSSYGCTQIDRGGVAFVSTCRKIN